MTIRREEGKEEDHVDTTENQLLSRESTYTYIIAKSGQSRQPPPPPPAPPPSQTTDNLARMRARKLIPSMIVVAYVICLMVVVYVIAYLGPSHTNEASGFHTEKEKLQHDDTCTWEYRKPLLRVYGTSL